jgi:acyl-ACP thioesterase
MLEKRSVFTVTTYTCNADGDLHLHSLMQQLQEIASKHAEELGVGRRWMEENGYYWVLVNFRMDITRLPKYGETIILRTWPSGWDMMRAFRDFKGEDLNKNELFRATSDWMVIEKGSQRPMIIRDLKFDFESREDRIIKDMTRLRAPDGVREISRITVPYSSLDMNGHVNNTEYVRWGNDTLKARVRDGKSISSFTISYISEIYQGEEISLKAAEMEKEHIMVCGTSSRTGRDAFVMDIHLLR